MEPLASQDPAVHDVLIKELHRQEEGLELIASENYTSLAVMQAVGSVLTNKYAEGLPSKRYYGGCVNVDVVEDLARDRAKQLFGCDMVNVQPHSGAQANAAVYLATLKPGDTLLGQDLSHGGHLTHGSPVNSSGLIYRATHYRVNEQTGRAQPPRGSGLCDGHPPDAHGDHDHGTCYPMLAYPCRTYIPGSRRSDTG